MNHDDFEEFEFEVTHAIDRRIVDEVRRAGKESEQARILQTDLNEFGFGKLSTLDERRGLFRVLRKRGTEVRYPPPSAYRFESKGLIYEAVYVEASPKFMREAIFGNKWAPDRGASLRDFYFGQCLFSFVKVYRAYCREELHDYETSIEVLADSDGMPRQRLYNRVGQDPADIIAMRDEAQRSLPDDEAIRLMFYRTANGKSQAEIADELGMTKEAVSSAMRRHRKRTIKAQSSEKDGV